MLITINHDDAPAGPSVFETIHCLMEPKQEISGTLVRNISCCWNIAKDTQDMSLSSRDVNDLIAQRLIIIAVITHGQRRCAWCSQ